MNPLFILFVALVCFVGFVLFSSSLVTGQTRNQLVPASWLPGDLQRSRFWMVVQVLIAALIVGITQVALATVALDPAQPWGTRLIAGCEIALAVGWTAYAAGVLAGRIRGWPPGGTRGGSKGGRP